MIISASRRTDIPAYYADWFMNRLAEEYVLVPNLYNKQEYRKVILTPDIVDFIVFWSKNPSSFIPKLDSLSIRGYNYYFQFTLTPYARNVEKNLPSKKDLIKTFCCLSEQIGPERVIWRYDPIFFTAKFGLTEHLLAFEKMAQKLSGYTERCIFSFIELYPNVSRQLQFKIKNISVAEKYQLVKQMAEIAQFYKIDLFSCAQKENYEKYHVFPAACIDKKLIEKIIGQSLNLKKDKNQREKCQCLESLDLGCYNTCFNGCQYCYANSNSQILAKNTFLHDPKSPCLLGWPNSQTEIILKNCQSAKNEQLNLF